MIVFHCVCVCLCLLCIAIAFVLRRPIWFYSFFIRAVFSAVFSLTVLPGLLFTHWFFLVLLSMANKDSFIHSFIQCESLCPVSPTSLEICMCGFRFTKFTKFLGEVKMVPPLRYPKTKKLSDPPTRGSAHGPRCQIPERSPVPNLPLHHWLLVRPSYAATGDTSRCRSQIVPSAFSTLFCYSG